MYEKNIKKYPYTHIILVMIFTSFIGISIEDIVNKSFIGGGLYTALALTIVEFLRVKNRNKTKK
uniref:hypothetical protein n=1 Tax=Carnobacterium alterfunditum TaxID=28230 RepID=UPI003450547E